MNSECMIRRIRERFGPEAGDEYQAVYDGLMTSLTVIRDYFVGSGLQLYAEFFDSTLIRHLSSHDCQAMLDALDMFENQFNSFGQYQILFRGEVERLYRVQQELAVRENDDGV